MNNELLKAIRWIMNCYNLKMNNELLQAKNDKWIATSYKMDNELQLAIILILNCYKLKMNNELLQAMR